MLTRYRFQPAWSMTLVFAVLLPSLVGLGYWQLDRAAEKTLIRDRTLARGQMAPVDVNRRLLDPATMEFRRATVQGRYRRDLTIYLDNKVQNGVPGYEVVTPLEISESGPEEAGVEKPGRVVLVNRGWIPWGDTRQALPDIDTPRGVVDLQGRLRAPPGDFFTLEARPGGTTFEPRWQNLDLDRYGKVTGLPVGPLVLELAPHDTQGGGFARQPPEYDDEWIERHKAYAVQWFALALTLVVLYVALNLKKVTGKKRGRDDPDD